MVKIIKAKGYSERYQYEAELYAFSNINKKIKSENIKKEDIIDYKAKEWYDHDYLYYEISITYWVD